jgi:hypothetical protein
MWLKSQRSPLQLSQGVKNTRLFLRVISSLFHKKDQGGAHVNLCMDLNFARVVAERDMYNFILSREYHREVTHHLMVMRAEQKAWRQECSASAEELRVMLLVLDADVRALRRCNHQRKESDGSDDRTVSHITGSTWVWRRWVGGSRVYPENYAHDE